MATIEVNFTFLRSVETQELCREFEVSSGLLTDIDDCREEMVEELQDDPDGEWDFLEWEVTEYDGDYADPADFSNLNEYAEYIVKCEEHGEGYRLRYEDIGEFDFNDEYHGCWESAKDFIREHFDSYWEIPPHLENYIDWEKLTSDWMMDYSEYDGNEGTHIFRDC